MYCMNCGAQLPVDAAFCFRCGAPQSASSPPVATQAPPPRMERRDITLVAVTCPVCGGAIKDESRCGYCGSVVVITMDMPRIDPASLKLAVIDQHIAEYRSAVRRDHHDEMAHFGLGIAYYNLRLHEEAIAEIEEAVRLMPENPHIQFQLAVMHSEQMTPRPFGREPDHAGQAALKRVNRALTIRPNMVEALLFKAAIYSHPRYCITETLATPGSTDDLLKAIQLWELALKADPDSIRKPVSEFLRQPTIVRKDKPAIALGEAILRDAPQFRVKKGILGADRQKVAEANTQLWQFYDGTVDDPVRLLGAAKYVFDVIRLRPYSTATTRGV